MDQKVIKIASLLKTSSILLYLIFLIEFFVEMLNIPSYVMGHLETGVQLILVIEWFIIGFSPPFLIISNVFLYKMNIRSALRWELWGILGVVSYSCFILQVLMIATLIQFLIPLIILSSSSFILGLITDRFLIKSIKTVKVTEVAEVKKTLLNLGMRFTRLKVIDIAEKSRIDQHTIINIITDMISNEEIYADYFESSKSVSFNQQANISEIDNLMFNIHQWEESEKKN